MDLRAGWELRNFRAPLPLILVQNFTRPARIKQMWRPSNSRPLKMLSKHKNECFCVRDPDRS